ncbi:mycofactocin system transcriptional regulator [Streptomyces carpinensis]|uniref:Mycofactocin system transcriptional regulator n=1 Tax=Streptomyces carpinensis TaxID=66369 RepID=A0ABV1WJU6_9ACTN|nr:mycofactocin system transcriptional regulator [Streptomyces carpinensis]
MVASESTTRAGSPGPRIGRPSATSRDRLEGLAFELFASKGFEQTTVDDIAAAAGISRRTFFRYHASKNDLVWGDFDGQLVRLHELLAACPQKVPMMDALREAVVSFNRFNPADVPWHRRRMELILRVPALQADSTLRYSSWRSVVTAFVADRTGQPQDALLPRQIGYATLATCIAAYEQWLADQNAELTQLLDAAMRELQGGFSGHESTGSSAGDASVARSGRTGQAPMS